MKKTRMILKAALPLLALTTPLTATESRAQNTIGYTYDASGNRISRTIVMSAKATNWSQSTSVDKTFADQLDNHAISIAPNPTQGVLRVSVSGLSDSDRCHLAIYSTTGQLLLERTVSDGTAIADISNHPNGHYILCIDLNGKRTTWKIIKK